MTGLEVLEARARAGAHVDPAEWAQARAAVELDELGADARARADAERQDRAEQARGLEAGERDARPVRQARAAELAARAVDALGEFVALTVEDDHRRRELHGELARLTGPRGSFDGSMTLLGDLRGWLEEIVHLGCVAGGLTVPGMPKRISPQQRSDSTVPRITSQRP